MLLFRFETAHKGQKQIAAHLFVAQQ